LQYTLGRRRSPRVLPCLFFFFFFSSTEQLVGTKLVEALQADAARYAETLGKTLAQFLKDEEIKTLKNGERRGPKKEVMDAYIAVQDAKR
jgi:hypothetical protein